MFERIWDYLKCHDAPNWISMFFSLVAWPLALYIWSRRPHGSIRNLQIVVDPAGGVIPTGEQCPYLVIRFENFTDKTIYIAYASIRVTQRIAPHQNADRDLSTSNYILKFAEANGQPFTRLQVIIPAGSRVTTGLPLDGQYDSGGRLQALIQEIRNHRRNYLHAKYFTLRFEAMEGNQHKRVKFKL